MTCRARSALSLRNGRVLFAAIWLLTQAVLIVSAGWRPDHAYGFRMFDQSAVVRMHLERRIVGPAGPTRVPVQLGSWGARDRRATRHQLYWSERVTAPELSLFDVRFDAPYGAAAQLSRMRAAVEDVATHTPDDAETIALIVHVEVWDAGRGPRLVQIESHARGR